MRSKPRPRDPFRRFLRSATRQMQCDVPAPAAIAVFPQVKTLPGAQDQSPPLNRDRQVNAAQYRTDMGRHVVAAFGVMSIPFAPAVWGKTGNRILQIHQHVGIGVLLDRQRAGRVLDQQRKQTVADFLVCQPGADMPVNRVKTGTGCRKRQRVDDLLHPSVVRAAGPAKQEAYAMQFNPDLEWRVIDDQGYNTHIGPIRFAEQDDHWLGALDLQRHHMNLGGVAHGGVYMSFADTTMGIGAYLASGQQRAATIDFSAHFLAAAKQDHVLLSVVRLNRFVSGVAFMQAELWSGGRKCMTAKGIWKTLSNPPARP